MNNKIKAAMQELERLNEERSELYQKLKRSLAIQDIWPDAFKHGPVTSQVTGNPRTVLTFTITNGEGDLHEMDLADVPTILWSDQAKADIRRLGPFNCRKYFNLLKGE